MSLFFLLYTLNRVVTARLEWSSIKYLTDEDMPTHRLTFVFVCVRSCEFQTSDHCFEFSSQPRISKDGL